MLSDGPLLGEDIRSFQALTQLVSPKGAHGREQHRDLRDEYVQQLLEAYKGGADLKVKGRITDGPRRLLEQLHHAVVAVALFKGRALCWPVGKRRDADCVVKRSGTHAQVTGKAFA